MSEEFYKKVIASAWKENNISDIDVNNALVETYIKIEEIHGKESAEHFSNGFNQYWQNYKKENEDAMKSVSSSLKSNEYSTVCENGTFKKKEKFIAESLNTMDLMQMNLPPTKYLVKDFIAEGLTLLTAKSKSYKSWFCTQLCSCAANDEPFMGMKTTQCDSLYIDLEENASALKQRLIMQSKGKNYTKGFNVLFDMPNMDNGFVESLNEWLDAHLEVKLVIIDVYAKIKMQKKSGITDYDADYQCLSILKKFAESRGLFLVLVSHNRKMVDEDDVFSNILGSSALMGSTDECIVIHRKRRTDTEFTISSTGRTIPSNDFKAEIDTNSFQWKLIGTAEEVEERRRKEKYESDPVIATIKKLIMQSDGVYRGQVKDIISSSEYFGTRINIDSTTLGKKMQDYIKMLYDNDCIITRTINKGTAPKIFEFKQNNPFTI